MPTGLSKDPAAAQPKRLISLSSWAKHCNKCIDYGSNDPTECLLRLLVRRNWKRPLLPYRTIYEQEETESDHGQPKRTFRNTQYF